MSDNKLGLDGEETSELMDLLARCALKDAAALQKLYEKTSAYLNAVALRILREQEASSDVLQEAYIQVWNNASSYRAHKSRPLTWLTSIVRYRALDRLDKDRRLSARVCFQEDIESQIDAGSYGSSPEEDLGTMQLQQQLKVCLDTLSREMRRSIELAYLYGFSREEIAEKLATNTNTVKSWIRRGAQKLKVCLTESN